MTTSLLPLRGIACRRCRHVATPIQRFGCENCGAYGSDLEDTALSGAGTILNAVTVHRSDDQSLRIGSIHLDEGPMVRALLTPNTAAGARVRATTANGSLLFTTIEEH